MHRLRWPAALCFGLLLGTGTVGQEPGARDKPAGAAPAEATAFRTWRASEIIGRDVKNEKFEDLGTINDLAVDPDRARVIYGVVSFGGILGLGDKWFAVPWRAMETRGDNTIVLRVERGAFEAAQGFDKDAWPNMGNPQWAGEMHRRFGQQPYWEAERDYEHAAHTDRQPATPPPLRVFKGSDVIGGDVKNPAGEALGEIKDFVIDPQGGRIAYVVLGAGGILGVGDELYAVPWGALQVRGEEEYVLNADKERLAAAPRFAHNEWPSLQDQQYVARVYSYYHVPPYWEEPRGPQAEPRSQERPRP